MNDQALQLLEQYDIEVLQTRKGRGSILCETNAGLLIFKEYSGREEKLALQKKLLDQMATCTDPEVEEILPTKEGQLFVKGFDGTQYLLKTWREGRECNIYDKEECLSASRILGRLHNRMELPKEEDLPPAHSPEEEYEKHNRELRKVKKFLQKKGQKNSFEIELQNRLDFFLEQAYEVTEEWKQYSHLIDRNTIRCFCHGDYQYHNIIKCGNQWFVANFEKCTRDDPVRDLYLLMRKLLEKTNWSVELGKNILDAYEQERPLSAYSRIDLLYRLSYPEKFWKIANFYYNTGKAWLPGKNQEKLDRIVFQENAKQQFLQKILRKIE